MASEGEESKGEGESVVPCNFQIVVAPMLTTGVNI